MKLFSIFCYGDSFVNKNDYICTALKFNDKINLVFAEALTYFTGLTL